ncbi:MAG: type II secretion system protein GspG [Nitrospiraceae bacterium]|nr:type II secretion system protein GspG [Nitrospiraceae bacterium]
MTLLKNKKGSSIVETLIVLIAISVLIVTVMGYYEDLAWEAKQTALKTELTNIRQSILLFKITKGRYPKSLQELLTENFVVPAKDTMIRSKYLEPHIIDQNKNILDPFGIPFVYDPSTGKVKSQKKDFESW